MKRFFPFLMILGVLVIAIGGWTILYHAQQPEKPQAPAIAQGATPPHIRGDVNAPITLEEFGDFECPSCGRLYPDLKQVESEYGAKLKVIFHEFPLQMHRHALEASHAAEAAGLQNRFWEMHDLLYQGQDVWSKENDARPIFISYAKSLGIDVQKFTSDMDGSIPAKRNLDNPARGPDMGVTGTPTVFIDGKRPNSLNIDGLRNAINNELKEKGL